MVRMAALAALNIKFRLDPLQNTTNRIAGNLKLMRVKAMCQNPAYRVRQTLATQLILEQTCSYFDTTGWLRVHS